MKGLEKFQELSDKAPAGSDLEKIYSSVNNKLDQLAAEIEKKNEQIAKLKEENKKLKEEKKTTKPKGKENDEVVDSE